MYGEMSVYATYVNTKITVFVFFAPSKNIFLEITLKDFVSTIHSFFLEETDSEKFTWIGESILISRLKGFDFIEQVAKVYEIIPTQKKCNCYSSR